MAKPKSNYLSKGNVKFQVINYGCKATIIQQKNRYN